MPILKLKYVFIYILTIAVGRKEIGRISCKVSTIQLLILSYLGSVKEF